MSNVDKAAKVIDQWTQEGYELNSAVGSPHAIAERLAQAGLLAPDLPEPSCIVEEHGEKRICWGAPGCDIELTPGEMITTYEAQSGHDIEHTRQIALALLAAANYREEA